MHIPKNVKLASIYVKEDLIFDFEGPGNLTQDDCFQCYPNTHCPIYFSVVVIKTLTKSILGRKLFQLNLPSGSPSLREAQAVTQAW